MIKDMPRSLQKWEETRRKGKGKFIVLHGILGWGLMMFVIMTFVVEPRQHQRPLTFASITASAVIWLLAGTGFGWMVWTGSERKYQKFLSQDDPTSA